MAGLAATYSSASIDAVPSALRVFTAEFGMGSGVLPLAMATRPGNAPARPRRADGNAPLPGAGSSLGGGAAVPWRESCTLGEVSSGAAAPRLITDVWSLTSGH